jgi:hypothetical protein
VDEHLRKYEKMSGDTNTGNGYSIAERYQEILNGN